MPKETLDLFLVNSGTAICPLTTVVCMGKGKFVLDGVMYMRKQPITDLIIGIQQLGAKVTCVKET